MPKGDKSNHPNGYSRPTSAEREFRISQAAGWLLDNPNLRTGDFINYAKAMWPGMTDVTAKLYKRDALKQLNEDQSNQNNADRRLAVSSLKKQYMRAEDAGQFDLAFKLQTEINKLQGLHTIRVEQKIEGEMPLFSIAPISFEEAEDED